MMDTVAKIRNISAEFRDDFAFLNDWEFWVDGTHYTSDINLPSHINHCLNAAAFEGLVADILKTPLQS
jgi:hypothetical protein